MRVSLVRIIAIALGAIALSSAAPAGAALITNSDIFGLDGTAVGSGNGTLDFILFTESSGGSTNASGPFNGDNANTAMPTGGGNTTASVTFMTSIGELRDFYRLNFPDGMGGSTVNQMVIFVDVNETGGLQDINMNVLTIVSGYNQIYADGRDNPHLVDLSSATQNSTNLNFSGGTVLAALDSSPKNLPQQNVGAGQADYAIFTHVNPFSLSFADSTRILIHWESSLHNNGGETIFLSGSLGPNDGLPEPATLALLMLGALGLRRTRR